jgi:hypothetical protein
METADDSLEKIDSAKKCLYMLEKLKLQAMGLKGLNLDGDEGRYVEASLAHIQRTETCLNNLFSKIQKKLDVETQRLEIKRKNSRSIKQ